MHPFLKFAIIFNLLMIDAIVAFVAVRALWSYYRDKQYAAKIRAEMERAVAEMGGTMTELEPGIFSMRIPAKATSDDNDDGMLN